ncbi:PadR family transcriptional regulator [Kordiimonas aestuarii]|uniref:PadR family transcriptional regulator n=1 Tax=Kordiimonas aestuarii TaxID=1005925 RepID=UPI0021D17587|nr:PadR family transcriptional regulator [Kordiimonas aestuarii]
MDIRTLCLGILSLGDTTGYDIKKMVAEGAFSFFSEASYGSIYPALTKLTDEGLIDCRTETQESRPDKKIYSLTQAGRKALEASLTHAPKPDRNRSEFLAALLFAEAVSPERIEDLIAERIDHHHAQIGMLETLLAKESGKAARFVLQYGIVMQEAAKRFLEENRTDLGA